MTSGIVGRLPDCKASHTIASAHVADDRSASSTLSVPVVSVVSPGSPAATSVAVSVVVSSTAGAESAAASTAASVVVVSLVSVAAERGRRVVLSLFQPAVPAAQGPGCVGADAELALVIHGAAD
ncbi:hypothetical protein [Pseudonocardia sp. HH130630-07]|uniref:hypothetical protein n=1 Tax=Pseudonocardia sp. HH130630-07 TaxID=1690815 RepID=UPI0012EA9FE0|nr:hypothetical protein [Pseudonocardia sp. HH130630-07]